MKRFGFRGFLEIFVGAGLLLCLVTVAAQYSIVNEEYRRYRNGTYAYAVEGTIAALSDYVTEGEASLALRVEDMLTLLPLSESERLIAAQFLKDMKAGEEDPEAEARAALYAKTLLLHLSQNRTALYERKEKADGLGIPLYPTAVPTVSQPTDEEEESRARRSRAEELLGTALVSRYTSVREGQSVEGYRSALGYVEYRDGELMRILVYRVITRLQLTAEEAKTRASALCYELCLNEVPLSYTHTRDGQAFFEGEDRGCRVTVGVSLDKGLLCSFTRF